MSSNPIIATLATGPAIGDLRVLLGTLALWNDMAPTVYMFCDKTIADAIPSIKYPGRLIFKEDLNQYTMMPRSQLERIPGVRYKTRWMDFMTEKINLLEWIFEAEPEHSKRDGILFCDADICFMAPLPAFSENKTLALSPHEIRSADEDKYGKYNGGMLWMRDQTFLNIWREACNTARFYEQSALEEVAKYAERSLDLMGKTQNYGWWRLLQGERSAQELQAEWSINRIKGANTPGILIGGQLLESVHTHFGEKRDSATVQYNMFIVSFLKKLRSSHPPAKRLLELLERIFGPFGQN